nr:hypothetical protein [Tanacetum cinerariifolium]
MYVIEQPLPVAPAADSNAQVLLKWNTLYDAYNMVACLMLEEGKPVAAYVLQMKGYVDQLERLGYMLPQDFIVGLILNGLTKYFVGFVRNYNMHNMEKTIGEPHAMLIEYEKSLPKKAETPQVMMIQGSKIQKANKKSLKSKGNGKANGRGKDTQVYIPKPKDPKPAAKEHPDKDDTCHHCKEQLTPPYTPQHNDVSKRRNRTLLDMVDKTPYELWYGKVPNLSYLKVWGCEAFVKRDTPNKLQQIFVKCIFIGYPKETMGYYSYFPPENKIVVARKHQAPNRLCLNVEVEERSLGDLNEPASYKATMLDSESNKWIDAMNAEIQSMIENMVWVLVDLPPGCKIVGSKWIFKKKTDMDSIVHTYKAHLVANGYTQLYGVDYEETFSPIADIRAIRILISIAAYNDYEIWKMDVKTVFLNGYLDKDIYMVQHEEYFHTASEEMFLLLSQKDAPVKEVCTAEKLKVIEFGDSYEAPQEVSGTGSASEGSPKKKGRTITVTIEDMQKRRNYTFGGNEATKKPKKNQLKQQYGNFKAEGSKTLEQTFNRLQAIVSHLEFMDIEIKQDDLNQKFLTSLALECLISGKGEVYTASILTASTQVSPASADIAAASFSHDTVCAYIASQSNGSQIKYEDINQIDEDDIEEMDIKWNIALLSMRADRFWKKTRKKITIQGTDVAGFDKSKVECFNCHKMGHFTRECRAPRSQDRGRRENCKHGSKVEELAPKALMAIDGVGWDWSYIANEEENHALVADEEAPTEFALMAKSSSSSKNKGNYQNIIDDKGYWDSGCSWHMTGNISYLSDYEPYDGGYVSFGQGGGKITGKVAKASTDESMLWHRRLGHLNFKTMNKLVRHNLVKGLPSKCFENDHTCVACLKGKQHKTSCKTKLVNSVTKPLYTLHTDLFAPTSSQNKTPYELFNGITPAIGFLKPFGCHVMIINTLDHLGKFDAKGDEGYFIGYSMSSKAFRVFNKRTKKVEENLHVDFIENKLIEKGAGPNCNAQDACNTDAPESSRNSNPTATSTNPSADQLETLTVEYAIPTVSSHVPTACLDDSLEPSRFIVYQMDVKSAFLYGTIDEEVYMMQPPGFQDLEFPARVYKVEKAMYGLHQALRAWYGTLSKYLLTNGLQRGKIDQTLFIIRHKGDFILVQKKDGIFLSQDKYVGDILKKFVYSDVRSANTPMEKENTWGKDRTGKDVDLRLYRSVIGSLMYLTASRPDIMFDVYSDYGGATQDRKSTTGGCQFLGRRLISCQCKKQTIVATSTTEAEYLAAASGYGQVLWI